MKLGVSANGNVIGFLSLEITNLMKIEYKWQTIPNWP